MPALYIAARHGAAPTYPHPDLEPVLRDTYGVTIWHEQIIDILAVMTGCDRALGEVARRHNVPVPPVDINTSKAQYAVERTGSGWGVRISLATVHGISDDEVA